MINRLIAKDNLWLPATLLGIIFFILYTLLRSQDFLTIDGAIRCFEVMHHEEIFFHSNNHLLYPVYIFLWHKLLALIGVQATDVIQYGHLSQLMNGFFGAATLALFCYLINLITRSPLLSLIIASSYGFSYAFIIHATNAAEPITGLFWSILGILLAYLAIKRSKLWLAFLTGSIFALSLASYQSMVIIAPVALLFCWRSNTINEQFKRPAFSHMLLMSLGGLSGLILIFGWAYHRSGIKDIKEMVKTFFTLAAGGDATAVYGGIQLTKIVNLPLGFLNNLVHILPKDFTGIRSLITEHRHDTVLIWIILIAIFFGMGLLLLGITAWRLRDKFDAHHRTIVYAGVLGLLLSLFPPFYWGPHYDKLWLQPLFFIFLIIATCLHIILIDDKSKKIIIYLGALLILTVVINMRLIINYHTIATPYLAEAKQVATNLQSKDLIIIEWDKISLTYYSFFIGKRELSPEVICFPTLGDRQGPQATNVVNEAISRVNAQGGNIYFLGVLDASKEVWAGHLGSKCRIPFNVFDKYREQAKTLLQFNADNSVVTLRKL